MWRFFSIFDAPNGCVGFIGMKILISKYIKDKTYGQYTNRWRKNQIAAGDPRD